MALQRLFYNGRELADGSTLAECGIGDAARLHLLLWLQKPAPPQPAPWHGAQLTVRLMKGPMNTGQCIGREVVSGVSSSDTVAQLKARMQVGAGPGLGAAGLPFRVGISVWQL